MKMPIYLLLVLLIAISSAISSHANIVKIKVDGGIGPSTASYIAGSIDYAEQIKAHALIIELNTPGGLLESTRDIVESILSSKVPVVVYVSPSGARAGSAGVFITLAANIAAMAPGTNIGAAHPVGIGGSSSEDGDSASVMTDKITNDAAAFIRSIAQKRGRNENWAELAVRESISATENEALRDSVIDLISPNLDALLADLHNVTVATAAGDRTILTQGIEIENRSMNWREEFLAIISDPNIAYILLMLAMYGIMFELYNPGAVFPGVIGGIAGILAAYSLQMLPVNYAGLGLILLAVIMFIAEIKIISHGLLSVGAVISFLLGSLLLIDSPEEYMNISLSIIITSTALTLIFFLTIIGLGLKAQKRRKFSGSEAMVGERGIAVTDLNLGKRGLVRVHGETWSAVSMNEIAQGEEIEIENAEGLLLRVKKLLK